MHGRSFPTGHTNGAVLKALLKHLETAKGSTVALAWLKATRMGKDDLEDETRRVPLSVLHGALRAFVEVASRDAVSDAAVHLIAPDNLGVWVRVLRGTMRPSEAFDRLDASDSEYGRTTRWETLSVGPSSWRGKVHIGHDPALEQDGLLRLSRMAELSVVPALFGFGRANVASFEAVTARGHGQEFEVKWDTPHAGRSAVLGGLAGGGAGIVPLVVQTSVYAGAWMLAGMGAGVAVGLWIARDRVRKVETFGQRMRVHALERSLLLRDEHETRASSAIEGSVVAGQYRVVRRMGSGASGVIYEAVRVGDGVPIAIKLLRAVAAHDAIASDRLRREAEALGLAWHPNVVEVLDHGHLADGTSYLVMELLHGESLATRLKSRGRLSSAELLRIAAQVCDALIAVHAAGVVHRDLKPSNLFLSRAKNDTDPPLSPRSLDQSERVKLIDFGIARVEWAETRITNIGSPVGTPGYMSPEQESGGEVDARSDIFALGAVLYECLVGEPPPPMPSGAWVTSSSPGMMVPRDDWSAQRSRLIPPEWQPLLERMMAPLPRDRYPDARGVAQALRDVENELARAPASTR